MIIECRNGKIEIVDMTYNRFFDNLKTEEEREFIRNMECLDENENYDYVLRTDWDIEYLSINDIVFARRKPAYSENGGLFHVNHYGFGKFKITILEERNK